MGVFDGDVVGASLGAGEGAFVGAFEGDVVGASLGATDGAFEGACVGAALIVGYCVG